MERIILFLTCIILSELSIRSGYKSLNLIFAFSETLQFELIFARIGSESYSNYLDKMNSKQRNE